MSNTDNPSPSQQWSAQGYRQNAAFVAEYGAVLLDILKPVKGERVLDLGCGDGVLTLRLSERGASVIGVDGSPDMVAAAQSRGIDARVMDGHQLTFDREFHSVFSNAALHWMRDPDAVLAGVCRALIANGRFIGEFGGHGNVAAIVTAIYAALEAAGVDADRFNPWYFPSVEAYRAKLENHGFAVEYIELIARPTPLPTGIEGWLATFANPFLHDFNDADKRAVLDHIRRLLKPSLCDEQGRWSADYVRLRFAARKAVE